MMQTVCQLVNNEIISNKKCSGNCNSQPPQQQQQQQQPSAMNSARTRRDQTDFQGSEPRQSWLSNPNNTQFQRARTTSTDELLSFTQRMSSNSKKNPTEFKDVLN